MEGIIIPALQPKDEAKAVKETEEGARSGVAKEGDKVYLISNRCVTSCRLVVWWLVVLNGRVSSGEVMLSGQPSSGAAGCKRISLLAALEYACPVHCP